MSVCNNNRAIYEHNKLSENLRRLWMEHVLWTRAFLVSKIFNLGDLDAVTARLLRNPTDMANVLSPYYGRDAAKKFELLLREHLLIAADLVEAAKEGNEAAVQEQRNKWYANADAITDFLVSINPCWSKNVWQSMFYDYLKMTENEAVQLLKGQHEQSIVQYDEIQKEALKMADYMTEGTIRQTKK